MSLRFKLFYVVKMPAHYPQQDLYHFIQHFVFLCLVGALPFSRKIFVFDSLLCSMFMTCFQKIFIDLFAWLELI